MASRFAIHGILMGGIGVPIIRNSIKFGFIDSSVFGYYVDWYVDVW
tara:strand:- start:692 stop:829 length:138 start_codon:yes stop_codon:yes gene_type:complete